MSWAEGVGSVVQVRATDVLEMKPIKIDTKAWDGCEITPYLRRNRSRGLESSNNADFNSLKTKLESERTDNKRLRKKLIDMKNKMEKAQIKHDHEKREAYNEKKEIRFEF